MKQNNKHDTYVEKLCSKIDADYDFLAKGVPIYSKRRRLIGEIDVLGCRGSVCDIYEVKCSRRLVKAHKQLGKITKSLDNINKSYFYCGESDTIEEVTFEKGRSKGRKGRAERARVLL